MTRTPASLSSRVVAKPIPALAPVTSAVFPASLLMIFPVLTTSFEEHKV